MLYLEVLNKQCGFVADSAMRKELEAFDPRIKYGGKTENWRISPTKHQMMVGKVTQLVRDMMSAGATEEEFLRAIKYGLVVLDAKKHGFDYEKAREDFGVDELISKYRKI